MKQTAPVVLLAGLLLLCVSTERAYAARCTGAQVEKMIDAGFSKQEINEICGIGSQAETPPRTSEPPSVGTLCDGGGVGRVTLRSTPTDLSLAQLRGAVLARGFTAVVPNRTGGQETFDGSFRNAFVLHEDFVIDCATGLMWQRATSGPFTISEAFAHIHRLNRNRLGGYSDWRLPTAEELASLTQAQGYSTSFLVPGIELHLDPNYFRGESYFCMSSDRISSDPYRGMVAIITWAGPGNFGFMRPDDDYPVKAVRTLR